VKISSCWNASSVGARPRPEPVTCQPFAGFDRYLAMTRLTTIDAMPASTAFAIGDDRISMIGFDPDACC
jgi:hypothetical protein